MNCFLYSAFLPSSFTRQHPSTLTGTALISRNLVEFINPPPKRKPDNPGVETLKQSCSLALLSAASLLLLSLPKPRLHRDGVAGRAQKLAKHEPIKTKE